MSYVNSILQPGERILVLGKLHWIIYSNAAFVFLLALVAYIFAASIQLDSGIAILLTWTGHVLMVIAVVKALADWFRQWIIEIAVTDRRIIYKRGFINRVTAEMNMDKVESVDVTQSILGRLLDYGSIHVRGTGEGIEHLHQIAHPLDLRNCITAR
jgi:uncharacterized membrane protein YdbT with pleckstrin-like domain